MKNLHLKRVVSILLSLILCVSMAIPAVAAGKPAVEITQFYMDMNSVGGISVSFAFRNNSGKEIKYIDIKLNAYNRVDDPVMDTITGGGPKTLTVIGPMKPYAAYAYAINTYEDSSATGTPFEKYSTTAYVINNQKGDPMQVYLDKYNNFFVKPSLFGNEDTYVYLSDYEINNIMYTDNEVSFDNVMYNTSVDYMTVNHIVVTYMDGSKQTIDGNTAVSDNRYYVLQNLPFLPTVARYSAVYNYNDYKTLNPDLVAALGDNEKLLFEHFVNNGMKESRQGSMEFNLAAYKANNPDLVAAYGEDNVKYYEHFISFGKAEGRTAV